ncbi:MAG TPA: DUF4399 domain-containing protein [Paracoccaceae bacterium]|nr:DUF4399 domain-containing protein [Paracoccaceae bacterium]HMO71750.1 DUF4399 domain-containing protein [Paracoccaceae bacterium]
MRGMLFAALVAALPGLAHAQTASPDGARLYFVNLEDGARVTPPVTVVFGLSGMGVAPAEVERANTGHHHLLINRPPLGEGEFGAEEFTLAVPNDDNHRHFGGGQTQVTLELPAGEHSLQLVLGDHGHVPHDPPVVSERIVIVVE